MYKCLVNFAALTLTTIFGAGASTLSNYIYPAAVSSARAHISAEALPSTPPASNAPTYFQPPPELPESLSPYEIETFINSNSRLNLKKLWRALGIPALEFNGMQLSDSPEYSLFPIICDNCKADVFESDLDGSPGEEVLLRIGPPFDYSCRYLVFKRVRNDWKVIGHIDAWGKYREPKHTIIVSHGIKWLAIQEQGSSGSGVASYINFVYRITPRHVVPAFSYVSEGTQYGGPHSANREFTGEVLDCELKGNVVTVQTEYSVAYVGDGEDLFGKTQKAVFSNRLGSFSGTFQQKGSDVSKAEFEAVYDIDTLSDAMFLKYNYSELSQIATSSNQKRREWLRDFLATCEEDTRERRRLNQLLIR